MKINACFLKLLFCLVLTVPMQLIAQVSYNKRGGSNIGAAPQPGNLLNDASIDNVDHATGTLKVGIPIYEIKLNDIVVPISINYSALGLKAEQKAGCVGMGWELSAGGKITTMVNGMPDYDSKGLFNNYTNPMLQLAANGYLDVDNNINHRTFTLQSLNNAGDAAWDVYSYSLPNGGGKFMRTKGNLLTFPYNPLFNMTDRGLSVGDGLFYEFAPGDVKRVKKRYFFTKETSPRFTEDWTEDHDPYVSTENLSTITSARNKDTVSFYYESFSGPGAPWPKVTTTASVPLSREVFFNTVANSWIANPEYIVKEPTYSQTEVTTATSTRIKYITFPGGRVAFDYDPDYQGEDVLQSITIQQKNGSSYTMLKRFNFSYYKGFSHYLTGIYVMDANNQQIQSWGFEYNNYMPVNQTYGAVESTAQDRWGFYNGKTDNQSLVENPYQILSLQAKEHYPIYNIGASSSGSLIIPKNSQEARLIYGIGSTYMNFADREFVFSEAIKGTLKSIRTPTGAKVEYEYEPHKFRHMVAYTNSEPAAEIRSGGGIRVKSITHRGDGNRMLLRKEYKYGLLGTSEYELLPVLEQGFGMVAYPANIVTNNGSYGTTGNPTSLTVQNLSVLSHAVNDMSYAGGSYGIYHTVSEYLVKDTTANAVNKYSGKTLYFFHTPGTNNLQNNSGSLSNLNIAPPLNMGVDFDNLYGKPQRIIKQRSNPGGFDPVERHVYNYQKFNAPEPAVPQNSYSYFGSIAGIQAGHYTTADFKFCRTVYNPTLNTYSLECETINIDEMNQVDPLYFANIEFERSDNYYSGKYTGVLGKMHTLSDCYKLISDDNDNYGDSFDPTYSILTNLSYNSNLQATTVTSTSIDGRVTKQRTKFPLDYGANVFDLGIDRLKTSYMLNQPVEQLSTMLIDGTERIIGGVLNEFAYNNGLVNEKDVYQLNTNGIPLLYSTFTNIHDSRYELRRSSEYDEKGNLQQFAETGGAYTSLIWGYNGNYPIAQINNSKFSDVAYSGFESQDFGNWNYNASSVLTISTPVGQRAYSLSGGSVGRSNLNSAIDYMLSYWLKDDAVATVTGGTVGAENVKRVLPGWKYIERKISGATAVNISGSGAIDEVKLHPLAASMSTYTYDPAIGLSSSTDMTGKTTYYQYDSFQRMWQVKDKDGNILKRLEYNYGN